MEHEMNFFDLCAACVRAIGRGCMALGRLLERMARLTWRYWWIVLTMVVLFIAAAIYYTRQDNLTFKVNATAMLNGPTIQQFEQAFAPLRSGQLLDKNASIAPFLNKGEVKAFETYRVVDCKNDGIADYGFQAQVIANRHHACSNAGPLVSAIPYQTAPHDTRARN